MNFAEVRGLSFMQEASDLPLLKNMPRKYVILKGFTVSLMLTSVRAYS